MSKKMTWLRLIAKNGARRKLRTTVTLLGVAIAIAALFSLLSFQRGYQAGIQGELDRLGAHVLVVPKGCPYDAASMALHGASWPCYLKAAYLDRVQKTHGVDTATPILMNALYDASGGEPSVYLGAQPSLLALKREWRITGAFPVRSGECLVGAAIAASAHLIPGASFALPGLPGHAARVSGVLAATHGADDKFIYIPLADAQKLFGRPAQLTHILVRLTDPNTLDQVVSDLRGCDAGMDMNVVPLAHLFRTIQLMVNSTRTLLGCVAAIALLVAAAGVSNAILMAVTERTREIGVMRAVGASSGDIFRLIVLETVAVCVVGGLVGIGIAGAGATGIETWLRERLPFSPHGALLHLEPDVMAACLGIAALLGGVAGLLPAWRAARLSPVEAIRAGA